MTARTVTVLGGLSYPESPRWHEGRIWCSDLYAHQVISAGEDGGAPRVEAEVRGQPSGLGWLPDGRLLVVSMRDRRLLRREANGGLVTHADLADRVGGDLNDMVVDAVGRAYVGNLGFDLASGGPMEPAALVRVDPDGGVVTAADELWFPNGSVITDEGVLLVSETFGNRVSAFDIAADGTLSNRRTWAKFGDEPTERRLGKVFGQLTVAADGCALDAEGALWVADAVGRRVLRVRSGGQVIEEITLAASVFACALGGRDGRTLFLCTAPDADPRARAKARDGSVVSLRVEVSHAGRPLLAP
jgi:sugar lactone lactonase YvrE